MLKCPFAVASAEAGAEITCHPPQLIVISHPWWVTTLMPVAL